MANKLPNKRMANKLPQTKAQMVINPATSWLPKKAVSNLLVLPAAHACGNNYDPLNSFPVTPADDFDREWILSRMLVDWKKLSDLEKDEYRPRLYRLVGHLQLYDNENVREEMIDRALSFKLNSTHVRGRHMASWVLLSKGHELIPRIRIGQWDKHEQIQLRQFKDNDRVFERCLLRDIEFHIFVSGNDLET